MLRITFETISGEQKEIEVPTTWSDITWTRFVELDNMKFENEIERLSAFSGVNFNLLMNNLSLISTLYTACQFMYEDLTEFMYCKQKYKTFEVANDDWGKIETAKKAMLVEGNWSGGSEVVKLYADEDISNKPCTEAIGVVAFFLNKFNDFLNSSKT